MGLGFRVLCLGLRILGLGFRVSGLGFRVLGFGFRILLGFGVERREIVTRGTTGALMIRIEFWAPLSHYYNHELPK